MDMLDQLWPFLGQLAVYGGAGTAGALWFGRKWTESLIDTKFAAKLEGLRHSQAQELQSLQAKVDSLLSGSLKLQDAEFQCLPEAWSKQSAANRLVASLVSIVKIQMNLDEMDNPRLEYVLANSDLPAYAQEEVRQTNKKSEKYYELKFYHRRNLANDALSEVFSFVEEKHFLMPPALADSFMAINNLLAGCVTTMEVGRECGDHKMTREAWETHGKKVEPLREELRAKIRAHLESHGLRAQLPAVIP